MFDKKFVAPNRSVFISFALNNYFFMSIYFDTTKKKIFRLKA